jgi:hypothetical protein
MRSAHPDKIARAIAREIVREAHQVFQQCVALQH